MAFAGPHASAVPGVPWYCQLPAGAPLMPGVPLPETELRFDRPAWALFTAGGVPISTTLLVPSIARLPIDFSPSIPCWAQNASSPVSTVIFLTSDWRRLRSVPSRNE